MSLYAFDERRDIALFDDTGSLLKFTADFLEKVSRKAIEEKGVFTLALAGGSTPRELYRKLAREFKDKIDWKKTLVFFGDERSVPPDNPESNYHMALEAGFDQLPVRAIHRMVAENHLEENAKAYEDLLKREVGEGGLDFILLGMGDDGHTASLFPKTHALHSQDRLCVANYVPEKKTWRMTLTMPFINRSSNKLLLVTGSSKKTMVRTIFEGPYDYDLLPSQAVGTPEKKALWILDKEASSLLSKQKTAI